MPTCVVVDQNTGFLLASSTPINQCTSFVMMDATGFNNLPTLTDIFSMPVAQDLSTMWMTGFALPVIIYLSSWALQTVINFVK